MSDDKSLINIELGDLTKPATVLIEKISNAIGIWYEPTRIVKKAGAEAEADKIKALAEIELNGIQERSMKRLIFQESKKQENMEFIATEAIRQLPLDANVGDLEEDWLVHFFDKCDKISDKQMQSLWSRLLVGEATTPGSYSKRTVDFVASMDKTDAELFTALCQFTWNVTLTQPSLFIYDHENEVYKESGADFGTLKHLDAIGLISFEFTSGYNLTFPKREAFISYFGKKVCLEFSKDKDNVLQIGTVLLTQAGEELFHVSGAEENKDYFEYACEQLSKEVVSLKVVDESN